MVSDRSVEVQLKADISQFSRSIAQAALESRALSASLGDSDKNLTKLDKSSRSATTGLRSTSTEAKALSKSTREADTSINQLTGRIRLFANAAATVGPALIPLGASVVPVLSGAAVGLTAAAGAAGVAVLALNGVGDALGALNDYQLERTPENLAALNAEFEKIGPDGEKFVRFIDSLEPGLRELQALSRAGLLPGVQEGIENLLPLLPRTKLLITDIAQVMGELTSDAGSSLAGDEFRDFFDYLGTDAAATLDDLARATGNFGLGFSNLLVGLAPATRDFTGGLDDMARRFADWSAGLENNDGFQEFVDYVRQSGPQAVELLGQIAHAAASIASAAAPVGEVVLPILTNLVGVLGTLADSPIGTPFIAGAAALTAYTGIAKLAEAANTRLTASTKNSGPAMVGLSKAATGVVAALAGLAVIDSVQDKFDDTRFTVEKMTAGLLDLIEASSGDIPDDLDGLADSIERLADPNQAQALQDSISGAIGGLGEGSQVKEARDQIESLDGALAKLVSSAGPEEAAAVFDALASSGALSGEQLRDLAGLLPQYKEALTAASNEAKIAAGATDGLTDATDASAEAQRAEKVALNEATQAMRDKTDAALSAFGAQTAWGQAVADAKEQVKTGEKGINAYTEAGRNNRAALDQLAASWNNSSTAVKNNQNRFREARATFIETAIAMNVPEKAARALARQLLEIPRSRVTEVTAETGQAVNALKSVRDYIDSVRSKEVTITTILETKRRLSTGQQTGPGAGGLTVGSAEGNFLQSVRAFARGGDIPNRHQPEFAGPGPARLWREEETGGESYIPHKNDSRRPRARSILEETANLFGGRVEWGPLALAAGGMVKSAGLVHRVPAELSGAAL